VRCCFAVDHLTLDLHCGVYDLLPEIHALVD
jgi:hypothetical protein